MSGVPVQASESSPLAGGQTTFEPPLSLRKGRELSEAALFCSRLFAGGAIDHAVLALRRKQHTPYGIRTGAAGSWTLAAFDAALALATYVLHRRL
jgi:hypothetical protein